jgi:hypothetical protein
MGPIAWAPIRTSIVDHTQRAHDHPNLWLAGGGSFVTASLLRALSAHHRSRSRLRHRGRCWRPDEARIASSSQK